MVGDSASSAAALGALTGDVERRLADAPTVGAVLRRPACFHRGVVVSARSAVAALLVDRRGWVLMQLRDERAPVGPGLWSTVGGAVERDEEPADAVVRELAEETGLVGQRLLLWFAGELPANAGGGSTQWHAYAGSTAATDADIVVGEGVDIRFVPPGDLVNLPLVGSARLLLDRFLRSATYVHLADDGTAS